VDYFAADREYDFVGRAGCDVLIVVQCTLSHACLEQTRYLLEGLEVDETGMKKNLESTKGAVVSEAVMMGLGKTIGRQGTFCPILEALHAGANNNRRSGARSGVRPLPASQSRG
jgi:adenylosuccinate lyase